jgi:hypothetical protein
MTSQEVRERLVETVEFDLVGPTNDHAFAHELLPQSPQRWYLTWLLGATERPGEETSLRTVRTNGNFVDSGIPTKLPGPSSEASDCGQS